MVGTFCFAAFPLKKGVQNIDMKLMFKNWLNSHIICNYASAITYVFLLVVKVTKMHVQGEKKTKTKKHKRGREQNRLKYTTF